MNKKVRTVVYDEELPLRIIANTAAIMGITLGKAIPEVVGADVRDEERAHAPRHHRVPGADSARIAGEHAAVFRRCRLRREE